VTRGSFPDLSVNSHTRHLAVQQGPCCGPPCVDLCGGWSPD